MTTGTAVIVRDCWRVERPAGFVGSQSDWRRAECWEVTIWEEKRPGDGRFSLRSELVAQINPRRWCLETSDWLPVEAEPVPGVYVPGAEPYRFNSLGKARARATDLITLLAGKMTFEQVRLHKST